MNLQFFMAKEKKTISTTLPKRVKLDFIDLSRYKGQTFSLDKFRALFKNGLNTGN